MKGRGLNLEQLLKRRIRGEEYLVEGQGTRRGIRKEPKTCLVRGCTQDVKLGYHQLERRGTHPETLSKEGPQARPAIGREI